jgi:hypothetical protein
VTNLKEQPVRRLTLTALACAVFALAVAPVAAGAKSQKSPFAKGNRSAALLGEWWQTMLAIPVSKNPLVGNGDRCVFLSRHVLAPALDTDGEISCTVGKNTSILPLGLGTECSDAEEPPFFGADHKARRACAIAADDGITVNEVGIDGTIYDISAYRVQSPDRKVRLPADDLFDLDATSMRFTADGWAALIEPLARGHHVITVRSAGEVPGLGPVDATATIQLEVTRR